MTWASLPFLISSSVILACAQRLMRKICPVCKEPVTYPPRMYEDLGLDPNYFEGSTLYRGRGCERCKNTGYAGRMAIIEAMTVSEEIKRMVIGRAGAHEIGKVAISLGMKTLRTVALERAREGVTTLEQTLLTTSIF
jgi:type IV pilus assembly protein PilB